ncbi:MAG: F0F1 ATP synthase subunit alpha, partial [Clostridiales bacterium]|nr:F0F1 ATP synthase subunit alpha [Clostridiales bacterium]
CSGLANAEYGEMLEIENGTQAIVFSLSEGSVGAIVLDDDDKVSARMVVKTTGMIVSVPVGNQLLGRVVNPLGKPIDGLGEFVPDKYRPIEAAAPAIKDRDKVNKPMKTGILAVDSMIPIGCGQRELIIGDRQTGKTSIAVDTILNQKGKDVICVYVAIGQKSSTVSDIVSTLTEHGAMDYTVIVSATARDSAPLQYIAPYAGCAIAEEFMYAGKDVLIVYDDLSKHAVAYRAMSLLLKRPPGREAYPGDIFYLHSRLLERAARLSPELGGGSITALPIVETLAGDISAYIPTNIISITDGQIFLESDLFNAGIRPAINVGLSVSRVGGSAQSPAMRKVSGKLRLDLSQYRELAVFAQFGADLDDATSRMLEKGKRMTEIIKQDVHVPMREEHQIILLYLTTKELIKNVPVERMTEFKDKFLKYFDINYSDVSAKLAAGGQITMDDGIRIDDAVSEFLLYFLKDGSNE